jgi:hypothetical protein
MTVVCRLLIVLMPASVVEEQKPGRAICRLERNEAVVSLSGELRITVSIEGPAPVEVEIPTPLTASKDWRVRTLSPKSSLLSDGRERWEQSFLLEPFQVGSVPLKLEPIHYRTGNEVLDWPLTWKPLEIKVVSVVSDPDREAPRPVTDIEIESRPERQSAWRYAILLIVPIGVAAAAVAGAVLRRRSPPMEISATERALTELNRLRENDGPRPDQLPQVADALRRFLEWRFQLAATRQTTSEFVCSLRKVEEPEQAIVEKIGAILNQCDLVKFAGTDLAREACQSLLRGASDTVTQLGQLGRIHSAA